MKSFVCIAIMSTMLYFISAVKIKDCGGQAFIDYPNIKITGCSPDSRFCIFQKNHTAQLSIPFAPRQELTSLEARVAGIIAGIHIPFPLPEPQACGQSLACPVAANTTVTYNEGLPVKPIYPSISLTVQWELVNQNGGKEVCIRIPVRLQ